MNYDISIFVIALCVDSSNPFLYCYFGQLTTESYANIGHRLFECDWQQLPINFQKYIILMIADIQIPLRYNGFGIVVLDLRTFIGVSKLYSAFILRIFLIDLTAFFQLVFYLDISKCEHFLYGFQNPYH